jgi:putative ABC transport system substrate-binding protein
MDRRAFICGTGALLAVPRAAQGQTPGNARRVGIIQTSGLNQVQIDGLRKGLREMGLEEGKHITFEIRDTQGDLRAVDQAAKDLERANVALIYTMASSVTLATKWATTRVPIVFSVGVDPVAAGLVESLAKPGGRFTGISNRIGDLTGKRLEILKRLMPGLRSVVTFYNPGNSVARAAARLGREAGRQLGVQFVERPVGSVEELRQAREALKPREVDAYLYTSDAMVTSEADRIIAAARAKRLGTMFHVKDLVVWGALTSYGVDQQELGRLSARYVQQVLAGTSTKDLPVENYDKIELALNRRTAREIGVTIPPEVLALADEVIQ